MAIQFIIIVALNVLYFALQVIPRIVLVLVSYCWNYRVNKIKAEKQELKYQRALLRYWGNQVDNDMMVLPLDVKMWKETNPWTVQRDWIIKNEMVLSSFPGEAIYQDQLAKLNLVARYNSLTLRR